MKKISNDTVRTKVFDALGKHYSLEVPLYADLLDVIRESNQAFEAKNPGALEAMGLTEQRLTEERHGAIRLGTPKELQTFSDIFKIMGMHATNYYDLTPEGHPIHSTAFRPIAKDSLAENPSRMFCSLLRTDLLPEEIRDEVKTYLESRKLFSNELQGLIKDWKKNKGFTNQEQMDQFAQEVVKTLTWSSESKLPARLYTKLKEFSDIAADICAGVNINHLTPVALDIDDVYKRLNAKSISTIDSIQGPPLEIKVLLNQTSFTSQARGIRMEDEGGQKKEFLHKTQFGEIESRWVALKQEGREHYDRCTARTSELMNAMLAEAEISKGSKLTPAETSAIKRENYNGLLKEAFKDFPADAVKPGENSVAYYRYEATEEGRKNKGNLKGMNLDELLEKGYVKATQITYEDFLPASAARIFDSNLENVLGKLNLKFDSLKEYKAYERKQKKAFIKALGHDVINSFELYSAEEAKSKKQMFSDLGLRPSPLEIISLNTHIRNDPALKLQMSMAA